MTGFQIIALMVSLTALFSYINSRWLKLPSTIGVMLLALLSSLSLAGLKALGIPIETMAISVVRGAHFDRTLMQGLLSFLLFAGSLHLDLAALLKEKVPILILATVGVFVSTVLTGMGVRWLLPIFGLQLGFAFCFLFGALISPTDPVAVVAILKTFRVPKTLEIKIAGESLFNDGVGVIAFVILSEVATEGGHVSVAKVGLLFIRQALGGALFGLASGWAAYLLLKSARDYQVVVLLTLALATGGYAVASALELSGPIAIVVAGLLIGNQSRKFAMEDQSRRQLDQFWELVEGVLNGVLFVLIGLEVLELDWGGGWLLSGLAVVPLLLLVRWLSVAVPIGVMRRWHPFSPGAVPILTWGGLRGGIPVALALSLAPGPERELILSLTYVVVIFSILVQGLTIQRLVKWYYPVSSRGRENT